MSPTPEYWNGYDDLSTNVYHYTPLSSALLILASKRLRFGPIANVNDPVEISRRVAFVAAHEIDPNERRQVAQDAVSLMYAKTAVLCCSSDSVEAEHHRLQSTQVSQNETAVAPFSSEMEDRGFYRMRMWAQYAGNHTGICVVMNREMLSANVKKDHPLVDCFDGPVQYGVLSNCDSGDPYLLRWQEYQDDGIERAILHHLKRNWQAEYFFKRMDWRDEREYRWVLRGVKTPPAYVNIDGAIRAVILGCRFSRECISAIQYLAGKTPIYRFSPTIGQRVLEGVHRA